MKQHNIIHVTLGKANPDRQNGVNKVVFQLAHHQHINGHKSSVWGITKTPVVNFESRIFETRLFKDVAPKFNLSRELRKAIKQTPKDVLFHLHGAFLPQLYAVARCLRKNKLSYIYTPHGAYNTVAMERSNVKKKIYISLFENYLVKNARFIHIIGKSEERGIRSVFGEEVPVRLVPNGQCIESSIKQIPPSTETIHFGFVGRLDIKTKGIDLLLTGFSQFLKNSSSHAMLHIIGDGKERATIEALISKLNITKSVVLHGALFGKEKEQILQQLHYFCLTSRNEGLPGVVLEALALGKPCIVSYETNMGEYITNHEAGYSLRDNTEDEICATLSKAAKNAGTKIYSDQHKNALDLIEREFDWSILSNNLISEHHAF